jgi:type IV pilus assembly protein PilC
MLNKTKNFLWQFTEQLTLLYQSGIPLSQSFDLLAQGKFHEQELAMFKNIEHNINRGQSLYLSLKRYPEIFPKFYLILIELGEVSGRLGDVLQDLSRMLEAQMELKRKITAALFYPLTVLCINTLVVFGLLWFIVPQYAGFFAKAPEALPLTTQILLSLSAELHGFWWLNLCVCAFMLLGFRYIFKKHQYQQKMLIKITQMHGLKTLIRLRDLGLLCRNLSLCLKAGLTLTQALNLCAPLSLNPRLHEQVQEVILDINRGKGVVAAFKKHEFPGLMLQLLKIGETTGYLEAQFLKIANIYDKELVRLLDKITRLIEPLMMVVLGGVVGLIMYALYQPLIQLGSLI